MKTLLAHRLLFVAVSLLVLLTVAVEAHRTSTMASAGSPRSVRKAMPVVWWAECGARIAHALGAHDDVAYVNSAEAFAASYARGFRVFEVDFRFTSDSAIVVSHDWYTPSRQPGIRLPPSEVEYLSTPLYTTQTPISLRGFASMVAAHEDAVFVLDMKDGVSGMVSRIADAVLSADPSALARLVPQLRYRGDTLAVAAAAQFPHQVFTLYATSASDSEIVEFVREQGIPVVVVSEAKFNPYMVRTLSELGARVYVHTVNTESQWRLYEEWGASGIMTDVLPPGPNCSDAAESISPAS